MKLKNAKKQTKTKKQTKKQQKKVQVQQTTNYDEQQQQRDDALVDIKQDLIKKQQLKPKVNKRIESNKLEETQIDTSKIAIEKTEEVKKPVSSWVVQQKDVKDLLKKDFKLHQVQHQFQSLTDNKINEELKSKKQKVQQQQKKTQTVGQMKFAPLGGESNAMDSKPSQKISLGSRPATEVQPIGIGSNTTSALNLVNSKKGQNLQTAPLEKSLQQLKQQEMERKMKQRQQQRKKIDTEINPAPKQTKGWFKKTGTQPVKQAPKVELKFSNLTFTNSNINNNNNKNQQVQFKGFQPLQKSKQEQIYQRKEQQFKFVSKKEQQQRKKKRQQEELQKQKV